MNCGRVHEKRD